MKKRLIIRNDEPIKVRPKVPSTFTDRVSKTLSVKTKEVDAGECFPEITVKKGANCALGRATTCGISRILSDKELSDSG